MFDDIVGHSKQKFFLSNILSSQKIPRSLLFRSPDSTGLHRITFQFLKSIFCLQDRNYRCPCKSCELMGRGEYHRDLLYLDEEKYTVDHVVDIDKFLLRGSFGNNPKVIFIRNIQNMGDAAQNKILKTLEEPPSNACFVLTVSSGGFVNPTILSRCLPVDFHLITFEEFKTKFGDSIPEDKLLIYYRLFEGQSDFQYYDDLDLVRKSMFYVFKNLDKNNFIDKLRFANYPLVSLKSIIQKYPFESNLRLLSSFFVDRLLSITGSGVFYNLDYKEEIRNVKIIGKQVFGRVSCLWDGNHVNNHLNNWLWIQGVLIGSETI